MSKKLNKAERFVVNFMERYDARTAEDVEAMRHLAWKKVACKFAPNTIPPEYKNALAKYLPFTPMVIR